MAGGAATDQHAAEPAMPPRVDAAPDVAPPDDAEERTPQLGEGMRPTVQPSAAWWRGGLIAAAALVIAIVLLYTVRLIVRPLALLFLAIVIGETLVPVVERLAARIPRGLAIALVYLVLFVAIGGLGWLVVPMVATQANMLIEEGPELVQRGRELADRWAPGESDRFLQQAESRLSDVAGILTELPFTLLTFLTEVIFVLFLSVYWLVGKPALGRFVGSLVPPEQREDLKRLGSDLSWALGGYYRGEGLTAAIMAAIAYTGLSIIGVDYALVLAIITGVGELIPVAGPLLAGIPAVGVALMDSPTQALIVVVFFVIAQQIESNILLPQIQKRQSHVHPLLALFAIFAGATVGGILGAIIAIPLTSMLVVLTEHVGAPAVRRWTGAPDPDEAEAAS